MDNVQEPVKQEAKAVDREAIRQLCNEVLYVLQRGHFLGEDAHRVELAKRFMKELKDDVTRSMQADAKAADAKPVDVEVVEAK